MELDLKEPMIKIKEFELYLERSLNSIRQLIKDMEKLENE